jgi:hypothetical protein
MKLLFKTVKITCLAIFSIFLCKSSSFGQAQATDPTQQIQEFTVKIDKLGDAKWEVSEKMTQAQWEGFKQGPLVNDPSITKRNMERTLSTYVIEDFNRNIDDMSRTVKMTFTVKAMAQYNGHGDWIYKLGTKNAQITKLTDISIMSTANTYINGMLTQQIYKVSFPEGATKVTQTADSFGSIVFTYSLGGGIGSYISWNNILGVLLIIAAIVLFVKAPKPSGGFTISINKKIANT